MPLVALLLTTLVTILALIAPSFIVRENHKYSYTDISVISNKLSVEPRVVMVLGGGITRDTQPRPTLQARLEAAHDLWEQGAVSHFLLSGDNKNKDHNEPRAMYNYLSEKGVPDTDMTLDPAGLSTYESCERAAKVYSVQELVIATQAGHLDRAIYLCRSFGIESYGFAAYDEYPISYQLVRETLSNTKAVFNVWAIGESTKIDDAQPIQ